MWKLKLSDEGFLSFKFSFTKNHQKWLQNSRFLLFLGRKDWKSQKFHKKPKFCIVLAIFLLYLKFLNFEIFGHFCMIFWGQFSFFGFLGVKNSKNEKFQKVWFFWFSTEEISPLVNFSVFEFLTPKKPKKRKLAPENHPKLTQEFKIKNFQVK